MLAEDKFLQVSSRDKLNFFELWYFSKTQHLDFQSKTLKEKTYVFLTVLVEEKR